VSESDGGKGVDGERRGWWRPKGKGERKRENNRKGEKKKKERTNEEKLFYSIKKLYY